MVGPGRALSSLLVVALGCTGANPAYRTSAADVLAPDGGAEVTTGADAAGEASLVDAPGPAPIRGLIGYWPLDDSGTTAVDQSGNRRDGEILGPIARVTGKRGGAFEFPGGRSADVGVRIPVDQTIDAMTAFTVAAHFKLRAFSPAGTHRSLVSRQFEAGDHELFNLTCNARNLIAYTWGEGSQETFEARGPLPDLDGSFLHAAATYDGSTLILYLNGDEHARKANFTNRLRASPSTPIFIGTNHNTAHSEPFDGAVDEVVLYDHALPPELIRRLARGDSPLELR